MALTKVHNRMLNDGYVNIKDFGAVGDYDNASGSGTDDTAAINAAYAEAVSLKLPMFIPEGNYKFTSQLSWLGASVFGVPAKSILWKSGNFDGILIAYPYGGLRFEDFAVYGATGNGGNGINLIGSSHNTFSNLEILLHGQDGFYVDSTGASKATYPAGTYKNTFHNLICSNNGRDGFAIDGTGNTGASGAANVNYFETVACNSNGVVGFHLYGYASEGYNYGGNIVCEGNDTGVIIEGIGNNLSMYVESNTTAGINMSSSSIRNCITMIHRTNNYIDNGTNNMWINPGQNGYFHAPGISAPQRGTSAAGRDLSVAGGTAGSGGGGENGGRAFIFGGDAAGSTAANGGQIYIQGGTPTSGGTYGQISMQPTGGGIAVGSESAGNASTLMRFDSTTKAVQYVGMTTTQRDALTAVAGMLVYNSTTNKLQVYNGTTWADLH